MSARIAVPSVLWAAAALLSPGCSSMGKKGGDVILDFPDAKYLVKSSNILHEVKLFFEMDRPPKKNSQGFEIEEPMFARLRTPGEAYIAGYEENPKAHEIFYESGMFEIGGYRYPAEQGALLFILKERPGTFTFIFRGRRITLERNEPWKPAVLYREVTVDEEIPPEGPSRKPRKVTRVLREEIQAGPHRIISVSGEREWQVNQYRVEARPGASITIDRRGYVECTS